MRLMEWFGRRMIGNMTPQERYDFVEMAVKEMLGPMSPEEKRDLLIRLLPDVSKTMLDGLTPEDRRKVVETVAPTLLLQLSSSGALTGIVDLLRVKKRD
jgi:hypothetical protein